FGGQITTDGSAAYSVQAKKGGEVSLDNVEASTTGSNAHVLNTLDGGDIAVRGGSLVAKGTNTSILLSTAADASSASNVALSNTQGRSTSEAFRVEGARLNLTLNSTSVTAGNGILLNALAGISSQGAVTQLNVINSQLSGDINSDSGSKTSVNLTQNTLLTSTVRQGSNVAIDSSSRWHMTGSSSIGALNHSGTVVFENTPGFKTLTLAGDLTGNGQFQMNTDLSTHQGDLLVIQGQTTGDHTLVIADSGKEPERGGGHLTVVTSQGGSGQFALFGGYVDAGAFRYSLEREGNNWALVNPDVGPQPCEVDNSCPPVDPEPKPVDLSKGSNAAVSMQTARTALWNAETDTLVQRLGDLRLGHDQGGLWIRAMDSRYKFDTGTSRAFNQNIHGLQIGADKAVSIESGKIYLGGFVGIGESHQDFGEGAKGQIDSKTGGAYATYLHDNGVYVDTVAKFSRYDNDVKMPNNLGSKVKGSFESNAYGVSIEAGKRFNLDKGWFVEPQIQLSSGRLQGGRYTSTDGLQVKAETIDTLQSRVGGLLGNTIKLNNGIVIQPYVKASWVTEHCENSEVRVNDIKLKAELPGDRGEIGLGAILQLGNQHMLSLDADYAKGNGIEQPWAVNLGYRFAM
ncbi:TPA: pertactin family autotransporter, partial [Pseudomonas aeruginosa]|nr:pertactin family autotransporter [Pseudomonas aeruginosa]HEP8853971.1 pertactin family autotransporter [Pseudomonas aeruginosa]